MKAKKPSEDELTLGNILTKFNTDEDARFFLEEQLWPDGPVCPRCNSNDPVRVYKMCGDSIREGLYNCRECKRQFTVTVGTIFEDSHLPLRKWLLAFYLISASKKGVSSLQLQRMLGIGSYRTALFMSHRIRHAIKDASFASKMSGTVEIDECYFGPKMKGGGIKSGSKTAVVALVDRKEGTRRSVLLERVTGQTLQQAVRENVEAGATINTDDNPSYKGLAGEFRHKSVRHMKKFKEPSEYYRREGNEVITTNFAESSFSLLRRGVIGTFHNISRKHLHLYVAEFDFRFNNRKVTDGERTLAALLKTPGKRLSYRAIKGA